MFRPLTSKEKKALLSQLQDRFHFSKKLPYNFFTNTQKKIFIFNKDLEIDFSKIRVNNLGLYFASLSPELRLTIEGSQLIGPHSKKNILKISDKELRSWIHGIDISTKEEFQGFVIIQHKKDFYGSGKYKEGKILNYIPKERRLKN